MAGVCASYILTMGTFVGILLFGQVMYSEPNRIILFIELGFFLVLGVMIYYRSLCYLCDKTNSHER